MYVFLTMQHKETFRDTKIVSKSFFASLLVVNFGAQSTCNCIKLCLNKESSNKTDHNLIVT